MLAKALVFHFPCAYYAIEQALVKSKVQARIFSTLLMMKTLHALDWLDSQLQNSNTKSSLVDILCD